MTKLCKQCSFEVLGKDRKDLAGLVSEEEFLEGTCAFVKCDRCGPICVDPGGQRIGT